MSKNLRDKLKQGLNSERENLVNKKFSINENSKFDKADAFYNQKSLPVDHEELITSTFKVPKDEFSIVNKVYKILVNNDVSTVKQTEIFRLALSALQKLSDSEIVDLYNGLTKIKTGKPKARTE